MCKHYSDLLPRFRDERTETVECNDLTVLKPTQGVSHRNPCWKIHEQIVLPDGFPIWCSPPHLSLPQVPNGQLWPAMESVHVLKLEIVRESIRMKQEW